MKPIQKRFCMSHKLLQVFNRLILEDYVTNSFLGNVKNSTAFNRLIASEIVVKESKGAGHIWRVNKRDALIENKKHYFPNEISEIDSSKAERYQNIRTNRNSKSKSRKSYRLFFLRSHSPFSLNSQKTLNSDKPMGGQLDDLVADKICFIENLESFMVDNIFINQGWTLIYINGRIGKEILERIEAKEVMHFGDLDYVGLNEYARIREVFAQAYLYIPPNYFNDVEKYGIFIDKKQKASNELLELSNNDEKVAKILDHLHKNNTFLEQEGYSDE